MKKNILIPVLVIVITILGTFVSFGASGSDTSKTIASEPAKKVEKTILFFMNPNGMPCQMQDQILNAMDDSLNGKALVTRIKTTVAEDRPKFSEYGIRGLPMLIVVDGTNKVLKRFTPGIQSEQAILEAIK
jgi:thioredoxin 1